MCARTLTPKARSQISSGVVDRILADCDAGVGEEHFHRAELGLDLPDQPGERASSVTSAATARCGAPSSLPTADSGSTGFGRRHARAFIGAPQGDRAADATRRTGDQHCASVELHVTPMSIDYAVSLTNPVGTTYPRRGKLRVWDEFYRGDFALTDMG